MHLHQRLHSVDKTLNVGGRLHHQIQQTLNTLIILRDLREHAKGQDATLRSSRRQNLARQPLALRLRLRHSHQQGTAIRQGAAIHQLGLLPMQRQKTLMNLTENSALRQSLLAQLLSLQQHSIRREITGHETARIRRSKW